MSTGHLWSGRYALKGSHHFGIFWVTKTLKDLPLHGPKWQAVWSIFFWLPGFIAHLQHISNVSKEISPHPTQNERTHEQQDNPQNFPNRWKEIPEQWPLRPGYGMEYYPCSYIEMRIIKPSQVVPMNQSGFHGMSLVFFFSPFKKGPSFWGIPSWNIFSEVLNSSHPNIQPTWSGQIIAPTHEVAHQKVAFWKGTPLISRKCSLVKHHNLARLDAEISRKVYSHIPREPEGDPSHSANLHG